MTGPSLNGATANGQQRPERIRGAELTLPDGWAGYEITTAFPMRRAADRERLIPALWTLLSRLHPAETQPGVALLMDNLHRDDAVLTLSRNARDWRPNMGLGIWPDREPPRTMTSKDLLDLEWGQKPRLAVHKVALLGADPAVLHTAWASMFGQGSTILTFGPGGSTQLLAETRENLKAPITDEGFQEFPFYFPLLGKKALSSCTGEQLGTWLGSTQCYLRESEEDGAILLLTRNSPSKLSRALRESGFTVADETLAGE